MSHRYLVSNYLIAIAFAACLTGCDDKDQPPMPPRAVLTMTVEPRTRQLFGPFASTVEARYQTQLGFQVSGRMVARDVYVGDKVKSGQRLAAIDPTIIQFNLMRAKADVADAEAQVTNAEGTAQRQQTLITGGNTTRASMDNAIASRDTAKARLSQTKAALRTAEDQIGYTELFANFDGVVTAWSAEVGQYVTSGQAIVTVARPDVREAVVDIPDELISRVKLGMDFLVRLQAVPELTTRARVREIGPLADAATRTHRVRMTLENPGLVFRIGTMLTVTVEEPIPPAIFIPATAVAGAGAKTFVWLLAPDGTHVTRRDITIVGMEDDKVRVASGLSAGDQVVIVGAHSLTEGQAVAGTAGSSARAGEARL